MSSVLVTGGAGFIGAAVVRQLIAETPTTVVNLDALTYAADLASLGPARDDPRHQFVQGDIRDGALVRRLLERHRPHAIIHLAAESHVDRSIDAPQAFIETNVVGSATLLQETTRFWRALRPDAGRAFRFLHVSTDEVFGSLEPGEVVTDATPYDPSSPYAASKAASDHLVRAWHRTYGLPTLITNCSNNFGPCQFPEKLIPLMIEKAIAGERLPVYGRGLNVRDWIFVEDHAQALLSVLERGTPGMTYGIGGGNSRENIEIVRMICALLDELRPSADGPYARLIEFVADRPGHDLRYAVDDSRVRRELGWAPRQSLESGLRRTVAWYLENRDWSERIRSGTYRGDRLGLLRTV